MKELIILIPVILLTFVANAKVSPIDIRKMLQEAKIIRMIIVVGYKDSGMLYRLPNMNYNLRTSYKNRLFSGHMRQVYLNAKVKTEKV